METDGSAASTPQELLGMHLEQNDALQLGSLDNGLRWVILPNRSPPARFEAHLEVHAGSGAPLCLLCWLAGYLGESWLPP